MTDPGKRAYSTPTEYHERVTPNHEDQFRQFIDDSSSDELSAALLVNLVLDPTVNRDALRLRVDALADSCPAEVPPWAFLESLGFGGQGQPPISLAHSRLADVLETGQGLPISLGVLLVHVARRQGLEAQGVNFPGRFLTRVNELLVDPQTFRPISKEACLKQLTDMPPRDPFAVATSRTIALRMLNNVKAQLLEESRFDQVLEVLGYQMILLPNNSELYFERGQVWELLGAPDAAKQSYAKVVEGASDSGLRRVAQRRFDGVEDGDTVWH